MKNLFARHAPFIVAVLALWMTIGAVFVISTQHHQGHFVYALDDAYIHMAMAKNFANDGVWGITKYEFNSTSSSILWTLFLAGTYCLTGVHESTPFVLNILFATVGIFLAHIILLHHKMSRRLETILLMGIVFLAPFPALIFGGMEHVLQIVITLPLFIVAAKISAGDSTNTRACDLVVLFILAPLAVLIRFEGLFVVFMVFLLFVFRKRWLFSITFGVTALAPLAIYQIAAVARGWYWLPNSILIRADLVRDLAAGKSVQHSQFLEFLEKVIRFLSKGYSNFLTEPLLLFLFFGLVLLFLLRFRKTKSWRGEGQILILLFAATTLFHVQLGSIGHFYRYEAYLVAIGIFITGIHLNDYIQERGHRTALQFFLLIALFFLIAFFERGWQSLKQIPRATTNIYEQQYQMARFVKQFYQHDTVAANDLGAINYYADIRCFDLLGLANLDVAKLKMAGEYNSQQIYTLAKEKKVKIALVYDHWFQRGNIGGLPSQWSKVGEWEIANNIICSGEIVSFYAVDPDAQEMLIKSLKQFAVDLPSTVRQRGQYLE